MFNFLRPAYKLTNKDIEAVALNIYMNNSIASITRTINYSVAKANKKRFFKFRKFTAKDTIKTVRSIVLNPPSREGAVWEYINDKVQSTVWWKLV